MNMRENNTRRIPWLRLAMTLTALVCASGAGTAARQALNLGPRVGDIIAFDPVSGSNRHHILLLCRLVVTNKR